MEFNVKLLELRNQKGLTQEELANALFVSRTAISKWESGRGYPNIDSLKAIASFFDITIDELLSNDELIIIADEDIKQKEKNIINTIFGLIDCSLFMLFVIPFFRQTAQGLVESVSLLSLNQISLFLRITYFIIVIATIIFGFLTITMQNCEFKFFVQYKTKISLILNIVGALTFIISLQPYAATLLFIFLIIKLFVLAKLK